MTPESVVDYVSELGGTVVVVASEGNGDPEMAWGDTFFFYDPDGVTVPEKRMPFGPGASRRGTRSGKDPIRQATPMNCTT